MLLVREGGELIRVEDIDFCVVFDISTGEDVEDRFITARVISMLEGVGGVCGADVYGRTLGDLSGL